MGNYESDIIRFEFGIGIIPFVNPKESRDFSYKVRDMRKKLELETSRNIPLIRIIDNWELSQLQYRIIINGKILADNNLSFIPPEAMIFKMISSLESVIMSNLDDISNMKLN